jgi:hypothetical protein
MIRLVQLQRGDERRVALVDEPHLRFLGQCSSIYQLASAALRTRESLAVVVQRATSTETLSYDDVYSGASPWRLMLPIDHPIDPARCLVAGTGLTHLGSARDRQAMHIAAAADETDSMRMFRWGMERGRPANGEIGVAPEWFYKGPGTVLRAHREPLDRPSYAEDGGEEAEVAGIYLIDDGGAPRRIGMAAGNEFSDHRFEKRNYLNLAGSKLRTCSIGPELVIDPDFRSVPGVATIERDGKPLWSKPIATGETEMSHSLANLEHHHFKFEAHRRPGDLHVHFYGAHSLSFGAGIELQHGDEMVVHFQSFGRALRNPLRVVSGADHLITAKPI